MNPIDFIIDLANPQLAFLSRALLVAIICAIINGVVGTHVVLRGMGFVGDALAHAVFPGIAVAFALGASVLIGGALAGLIVTLLITFFSQNRRINEDSVIGIFFASAFALGLVIMSRVPGYTGSLESVLFGSLTGVQNSDLVSIAFGSLILLAVLALAHRKIVAVSLDRTYAQAMGMKVGALDLVLYLSSRHECADRRQHPRRRLAPHSRCEREACDGQALCDDAHFSRDRSIQCLFRDLDVLGCGSACGSGDRPRPHARVRSHCRGIGPEGKDETSQGCPGLNSGSLWCRLRDRRRFRVIGIDSRGRKQWPKTGRNRWKQHRKAKSRRKVETSPTVEPCRKLGPSPTVHSPPPAKNSSNRGKGPAPHTREKPGPRTRHSRSGLAAQSSAALGCVMSAGTTQASNSSGVTKPSSRADSRRDKPLWCAFFAIFEALS